jgi:LysM repeat protein
VEYGETWYGIANQYGVPSKDLAAANPEVDPERLRSGTVLRIPRVGQAVQRPRTHTVSRGDTLFGIARRYGVSVTALRSANRITDDVVRLGQTLVIPREEGSR